MFSKTQRLFAAGNPILEEGVHGGVGQVGDGRKKGV